MPSRGWWAVIFVTVGGLGSILSSAGIELSSYQNDRLALIFVALGGLLLFTTFLVSARFMLSGSDSTTELGHKEQEAFDELLSEDAIAALKGSGDHWAYGVAKDEIPPEIAAEMISASLMDFDGSERLRLNERGIAFRNHILRGVEPRPKWQIIRPKAIECGEKFGTATGVGVVADGTTNDVDAVIDQIKAKAGYGPNNESLSEFLERNADRLVNGAGVWETGNGYDQQESQRALGDLRMERIVEMRFWPGSGSGGPQTSVTSRHDLPHERYYLSDFGTRVVKGMREANSR